MGLIQHIRERLHVSDAADQAGTTDNVQDAAADDANDADEVAGAEAGTTDVTDTEDVIESSDVTGTTDVTDVADASDAPEEAEGAAAEEDALSDDTNADEKDGDATDAGIDVDDEASEVDSGAQDPDDVSDADMTSEEETSDGTTGEDDGEEATEIAFRSDDDIRPVGVSFPFKAEHAVGEMLTDWHLRLVYVQTDEPIVELYDGETGEFVSDYWVSQFCDDSKENEGQGLACRGAQKRFRIAYDDLIGMQSLVRPVSAVAEWYEGHEGNLPSHDV